MAGLMSLSGGVVSTVVMWLLLKKANASLGVVGVCGALAHNAAQLCVAYFLTGTSVAFYAALPGAVRRAHRAADRACAQADAEALGAAAKHPKVKLFSRIQKHLPRAARLRRCFFKLLFSF